MGELMTAPPQTLGAPNDSSSWTWWSLQTSKRVSRGQKWFNNPNTSPFLGTNSLIKWLVINIHCLILATFLVLQESTDKCSKKNRLVLLNQLNLDLEGWLWYQQPSHMSRQKIPWANQTAARRSVFPSLRIWSLLHPPSTPMHQYSIPRYQKWKKSITKTYAINQISDFDQFRPFCFMYP